MLELDVFSYLLGKRSGGGGASSWNDLSDRPFYSEVRTSSATFAETPEHHFDAMGNTWWKVSDLVPTTKELMAAVFEMNFGKGVVTWTPVAEELLMDSEWFTGVQSAESNAGFFICRTDGEHTVNFSGMDFTLDIPSTGIYFAYNQGVTPPSVMEFHISYEEVKLLDAKYLPKDAIGGIVNDVINEALEGEY